MKKVVIYIVAITAACLLIGSIFIYRLIDHRKNGFIRRYIYPEIVFTKEIDLKTKSLFFYNQQISAVMLKDFKQGNLLFKVDTTLHQLTHIELATPLPFNLKTKFTNLCAVDSVILITNSAGEILRLYPNKAPEYYKISELLFDQSCAISANTLFVRATTKNGNSKQRELIKITLTDKVNIYKKFILPKQVDGLFCTDGWLRYNDDNSTLLYGYFYRGIILNLDTNLNIVQQVKTIDTVNFANVKIKVQHDILKDGKSAQKKQQTEQNNMVNRFYSTNNDKIYVLSSLRADNDKLNYFKKKQTIDVYNIKAGKYLYSFSLPDYKGLQLRDFIINKNIITTLYDTYLVTFTYNGQTLKQQFSQSLPNN
jgi:hypothetical protein